MHGVTKIFTGTIVERLFWFVVFVGVLVYFAITVHSLFTQFNSNEYFISSQPVQVDQMKLPSITICDMHAFLCSSYMYKNGTARPWCDEDYKDYVNNFTKNIFCHDSNTWSDSHCNYELSSHLPGCITINPSQNVTQHTPGRNLDVRFKLQSHSLYLFFHRSGEALSFKDRTKYKIKSPGGYNIILSRTDNLRLPAPFGSNCSTPHLPTSRKFPYSHILCHQVCTATYMYDKCGAVGDYWWQYLAAYKHKNYSHFNNSTIEATRKCVYDVLYNSTIPCRCTKPCKETKYDANIVHASVKETLFFLTFYFDELEFRRSSELPSYDKTRFMADIGGIVGLVVGMSLLSVFEVIVCVVLFVADLILKLMLKFC